MPEEENLKLTLYPHPLLKQKLRAVTDFDEKLKRYITEMFRIMYENKGIGLAANQAGLNQKIIVMNLTGDHEQPDHEMVFINPEVQSSSKATYLDEEGCLSFPDLKVEVTRNESVVFSALDEEGNRLVWEAEDLFSRCFQHELDHINGITFVDRLNPSERALISDQLKELESKFKTESL